MKMFYSSSSVEPTSYEASLQYQSDADLQDASRGLIKVSLETFSITVQLYNEVEPWCTTMVRPDYLISLESFQFTLQTLLEKGQEWRYIYEMYLFPMLSRWQHQGYSVVFVD